MNDPSIESTHDGATNVFCSCSVEGFPHGFALSAQAFRRFLLDYWNAFSSRPEAAWLPLRWRTGGAPGSSIEAELGPMRFILGATMDGGKLVIRLGEGTFSHAGEQHPTKGWVVRIGAPLVFGSFDRVTEDPYSFYQRSYERIAAGWSVVHGLAIDLGRIARRPAEGDLDFGGARLGPEAREAFLAQLDLLLAPVRGRGKFVFFYIGARVKDEETTTAFLMHPYTMVASAVPLPAETGGEVQVSFGSALCPGAGKGGFGRSVVPPDIDATFRYGRENVLGALVNRMGFTTRRDERGLIATTDVGDYKLSIRLAARPATLECTFDFRLFDHFTCRILDQTVEVVVEHRAQRRFLCVMCLDQARVTAKSTRVDPARPDEWLWKSNDGQQRDMKSNQPAFYESMLQGSIGPMLQDAIVKVCLEFRHFPKVCDVYAKWCQEIVERLHKTYKVTMNAVNWAMEPLEARLDAHRFYAQVPEPFSFQELRFDDDLNLQFDMMFASAEKAGDHEGMETP